MARSVDPEKPLPSAVGAGGGVVTFRRSVHAPLKGLFTRAKGGFFYHDGALRIARRSGFASLDALVDHYDRLLGLALSTSERSELLEFLKSL